MAQGWDHLVELSLNGVSKVGIAANVDNFNARENGLKLCRTMLDTIALHYPASLPRVKHIIAAGIVYLTSDTRRLDPRCCSVSNIAPPAVNIALPPDSAMLDARLVIVASKVNWYQTNHHTGQGRVAGYFKKALDSIGLSEADEKEVNALWIMCHWANTKSLLKEFGVSGGITTDHFDVVLPDWVGNEDEEGNIWGEPTRDVTLRLESFPSGTATIALVSRACQMIKGSVYARVVPRSALPAYCDLAAVCSNILSDKARFHVGSHYLTGLAQLVAPQPDIVLQGVAKAFLSNVVRDSSISRSPSVAKLEPNTALDTAFRSIVASTFKAGKSVTERLMAVVHGGIGGDAFADDETYAAQVAEIARASRRAVTGDELDD